MELFTFKAFAFGGKLDLNRLADKLGITRKCRWEDDEAQANAIWRSSTSRKRCWT